MCREWFQRFKSGDFDGEDRHGGGKEKIFKDFELEVLLAEDSCQTQEELAESLGVTQQAFSIFFFSRKLGNIAKHIYYVTNKGKKVYFTSFIRFFFHRGTKKWICLPRRRQKSALLDPLEEKDIL